MITFQDGDLLHYDENGNLVKLGTIKPKKSKWNKAKNKLPPNRLVVLIYNNIGYYGTAYYNLGEGIWQNNLDDKTCHVDYWRYLPKPPKEITIPD